MNTLAQSNNMDYTIKKLKNKIDTLEKDNAELQNTCNILKTNFQSELRIFRMQKREIIIDLQNNYLDLKKENTQLYTRLKELENQARLQQNSQLQLQQRRHLKNKVSFFIILLLNFFVYLLFQ